MLNMISIDMRFLHGNRVFIAIQLHSKNIYNYIQTTTAPENTGTHYEDKTMTTAKNTIRSLALIALLFATAACTQPSSGSSFDFDSHGSAEERPLYAY